MHVTALFSAVHALVLWGRWAAQEAGGHADDTTTGAGKRLWAAPRRCGWTHHQVHGNNWAVAEWQGTFRGEDEQEEDEVHYVIVSFWYNLFKCMYFSLLLIGESTDSGEGSQRVQIANRRVVHHPFYLRFQNDLIHQRGVNKPKGWFAYRKYVYILSVIQHSSGRLHWSC